MPLPDSGLDVEAWLSLDLIANLGGEGIRRLLREFGSPTAVFSASHASLSRVVSANVATAIAEGADTEKLALSLKW